MKIGEVLGSIDCTIKNKDLQGLKLRVVRLYNDGRPDKVVVASDNHLSPGNGDFVVLGTGNFVDYTITDIQGENSLPCINNKINMKIS